MDSAEMHEKYPSTRPANELPADALVDVALQVYARSCRYGTKVLHDRAFECRDELLRRLTRPDARDAARLDWLANAENAMELGIHGVRLDITPAMLRAAIDAAIATEAEAIG